MQLANQKLFTKNFILLCLCGLCISSSFNMTMPVLPLFLADTVTTSKTVIGALVSLYSLAALLIRPVSGWMVDSFQRRPVFFLCAIPFLFSASGYLFIHSVILMGMLRLAHGFSYGALTTSTSTMAVDIIPPCKIGTGLGLYSLFMSLGMAVGPMSGMLLVEKLGFKAAFIFGLGLAALALFFGSSVRTPRREIKSGARKLSVDKLILKSGITAMVSFMLTIIPYGLLLNFLSLYTREKGIEINPGYFFLFLSFGLIFSRLFSGYLVDRGFLIPIIFFSKLLIAASFCLFILWTGYTPFLISAVLVGVGFGILGPSYQTLFIKLASPDERGTANSTYFICWDLAVGISVFLGGGLADLTSLDAAFWCGTGTVALGAIFFMLVTRRRYYRNMAAHQRRQQAEGPVCL
ncbi:MFS transporter [Desulfovibrio sp. OttesenSCG-928-C14]|nr:MFS transporter [Desulfovibrio sp. OttesenSCG-928-C14]